MMETYKTHAHSDTYGNLTDLIQRQDAIRPFAINRYGERIPEYDCDNWPVKIPVGEVKQMLRRVPATEAIPTAWIVAQIQQTSGAESSYYARLLYKWREENGN